MFHRLMHKIFVPFNEQSDFRSTHAGSIKMFYLSKSRILQYKITQLQVKVQYLKP